MAVNIGAVDRGLRVVLGTALIVAPLMNFLGLGTNAIVGYGLMVIGVIILLTSIFAFCPIYKIINLSTYKD